ncbi:fimbria/pilus outer membrane usher protein [Providencia rettgeri]
MENKILKLGLLSSLISLSLYSYGDDYFDPSMLESQLGIDASQLDLSQFNSSNTIPAGVYRLQIEINRNILSEQDVNFVANSKGLVVPEFDKTILENWGVNVKALPGLNNLSPDVKILSLNDYIKDATVRVDVSKLKLIVTVPQIYMDNKVQGYIDPSMLDTGVSALFLNYFISGNKNKTDSSSGTNKSDSLFGTLNSGLNLGPWRLRSNMSYSYSKSNGDTESSTDFTNTYIMRALHSIKSTMMVGEISTGSDVFDSIPFKGIKISSDEAMLPNSQRGFAPEVAGIAQSNAQVTIRQNGYVVYQTYVSPGAFRIKDIYSSGNAGNLDVTVKEEDGTEKTFTVAYSSLPVMLRPGGYKYETSVGRYDGGYTVDSKRSDFFLGSLIYGLPTNSTLYGGLLFADNYFSAVAGLGVSLGTFGALSMDITHATANMDGDLGDRAGQSYRVRYSKSMMSTGTSIDLTALRYSTRSYFSFADFNNYDYKLKDGVAPWINQRQRASFTTSITQRLGEYGSVFLSGSISDYWEINREVRQMVMGYNGTYNKINYGITYSIDRIKDNTSWPENRMVSVNVSIPFSIFTNNVLAKDIYSTYSFSQNNDGYIDQQAGISGNLLDNKIYYGITQGYGNKGVGNSGSLSAGYSGSSGNISSAYSYSKNSQSMNASVNGGLLLHSGGVLFGRTMGDSMAIIKAEGAAGTKVSNQDVEVNNRGYALYPYISPYNANVINMDVNTLPNDVLLRETSKTVYPAAGAIVKVKFDTKVGYQAVINLKMSNGTVLPFGAVASLIEENATEENTGIVGDNNQLFMSGLPDSGKLQIRWGANSNQQCLASFSNLGSINISKGQAIRTISINCQ